MRGPMSVLREADPRTVEDWCAGLGVAVLMALGLFLGLVLSPEQPTRQDVELYAALHDRALLETPQQVVEARASGRCAFRIGEEYFVAENLPKEYVDYSEWWVRAE